MIRSIDLRSGNYVKHYDLGGKKLLCLDALKIADVQMGALKVMPIDLVREWFLRFQFSEMHGAFIHFKFPGVRIEKQGDGWYFLRKTDKLNQHPILYVHQLQNSFYWMAGEDLILTKS